jgi:hypothetical protein
MIELLLVLLRRWLGVRSLSAQGSPSSGSAAGEILPLRLPLAQGRFSVRHRVIRRARSPAVLGRVHEATAEITALVVRAVRSLGPPRLRALPVAAARPRVEPRRVDLG